MSKILKVKARQVFDSRGNPTVEAEVFTKKIVALLFVLQEHQQVLMKLMKKEMLKINNIWAKVY